MIVDLVQITTFLLAIHKSFRGLQADSPTRVSEANEGHGQIKITAWFVSKLGATLNL
jgi:hypothetical protein